MSALGWQAYGFEGDLVAEARELIVKGGNVILLKSVNKGTAQGVDVTRVVSGAPSIRYDISPQESQTPDDTSTKDYAKKKCCNASGLRTAPTATRLYINISPLFSYFHHIAKPWNTMLGCS